MSRRPKIDFWTESLPSEWEWALAGAAFVVWLAASAVYYILVLGRMHRLLESLAQVGVDPNSEALSPVLQFALYLSPLAGLPVAFALWKAARSYLLKSVFPRF